MELTTYECHTIKEAALTSFMSYDAYRSFEPQAPQFDVIN